MNKSDLIEKIVQKSKLPRKRAEQVVNLLFDSMTDALARGDRIEIRGFGSFISKQYKARTGRNPRTGEALTIPESRVVAFKMAKSLRDRLNAAEQSQ